SRDWSSDVCSSDLVAMAAAVDVQLMGGRLHAQFVEEDVGHVGVEMLARVDHDFRQFRALRNGCGDDARLDELRAGAQYGQYLLRHDEISSGPGAARQQSCPGWL